MDTSYKIEIPIDKHEWQPSPLADQVVLVSSVNGDGTPNVATKSFVSMVAFGPPPVMMFGCNMKHATARNVLKHGEFVINIPSDALLATCWVVGSDDSVQGSDRFEKHGLTPIESIKVKTPRVAECRAHLECALENSLKWEDEVALFGRIVAASMDKDLLVGEPQERYCKLSPFFFLEDVWAAPLGEPRRPIDPRPGCGDGEDEEAKEAE
jgi:flavin reductase (DIM6/NTAB) family NADH-FMN oxidoreductase RutF